MSEPTCPKCDSPEENGFTGVFVCGSMATVGGGLAQSDHCALTVAERERDEWQARALSMSAFIPDGTLCGDLQKARDEFREKAALFDEMRVALNWAEAALANRVSPARRIVRDALAKANKIAGTK